MKLINTSTAGFSQPNHTAITPVTTTLEAPETNHTQVVLNVMLKNGYSAPKSFYGDIYRRVSEIIPAMQPSVPFKLEHLCGDEFWQPLSEWKRQLAGRCMVDMVERKSLPLCFSGHLCQSPKRYMLV